MNKILTLAAAALTAGTMLCSCSDWTQPEPLELIHKDIEQTDPTAYQLYLNNLREYRNSDHTQVYAFFDNPTDAPTTQWQRLSALPDSIDIVVLTNAENINRATITEMEALRVSKGQQFYCSVDFDQIKAEWQANVDEAAAAEQPYSVQFSTYLKQELDSRLAKAKEGVFDGVVAFYRAKSPVHMTEQEKQEALELENEFFSRAQIHVTPGHDPISLGFTLAGIPANILNPDNLRSVNNILLTETLDAYNHMHYDTFMTTTELDKPYADKLGLMASSTAWDADDHKTGYTPGGDLSIFQMARYAATHKVAAIAMQSVQPDYYNPVKVYHNIRTAIQIANPAIR